MVQNHETHNKSVAVCLEACARVGEVGSCSAWWKNDLPGNGWVLGGICGVSAFRPIFLL